jgi:hypothetical protein
MIPLVALAVAGCGGASGRPAAEADRASGEPVSLAVRLEPGAVYEGDLELVQVLPAGQRVQTMVRVRTRVLDARGSTFQVEEQYGALRVHMNGERFDPAPEMAGMDDVRIRYALDPRGQRTGDVEALGVTEENAAFAQQLVASAGAEGVPLPAAPVRVGERWSASRALAMPTDVGMLEGVLHEHHRLGRIERDGDEAWAVILISGSVSFEPLEADEMRIGGDGVLEGERRLLLADGFTTRGHSELTITFRGEAGSPRRAFQMQQRTGTRMDIVRVGAGEASELDGTEGPANDGPDAPAPAGD